MRFIMSLALLIRLSDAAESSSVYSGRLAGKDPASPAVGLMQATSGNMPLSLASHSKSPKDVSGTHAGSEVKISQAPQNEIAGELHLNQVPRVIAESEIEKAIRAALGQRKPDMQLEITAHSREAFPPGEAEFPISGAPTPSLLHPEAAVLWRGYWQTPDGRRMPIWARVRALCPRPVIRLRADVAGGSQIESSMLEQVSVLDSALRADPPEDLAEYEGKILKHYAKAGSIISRKQISDPPLVLRNTMVRVDVISGSLHLRLKARAETDGQAGESIRLAIPSGRRQFLAIIQADGSATLNVAVESRVRTTIARGDARNEL